MRRRECQPTQKRKTPCKWIRCVPWSDWLINWPIGLCRMRFYVAVKKYFFEKIFENFGNFDFSSKITPNFHLMWSKVRAPATQENLIPLRESSAFRLFEGMHVVWRLQTARFLLRGQKWPLWPNWSIYKREYAYAPLWLSNWKKITNLLKQGPKKSQKWTQKGQNWSKRS